MHTNIQFMKDMVKKTHFVIHYILHQQHLSPDEFLLPGFTFAYLFSSQKLSSSCLFLSSTRPKATPSEVTKWKNRVRSVKHYHQFTKALINYQTCKLQPRTGITSTPLINKSSTMFLFSVKCMKCSKKSNESRVLHPI